MKTEIRSEHECGICPIVALNITIFTSAEEGGYVFTSVCLFSVCLSVGQLKKL